MPIATDKTWQFRSAKGYGSERNAGKTQALTMLQLTKLMKCKKIVFPFLASPTGWLRFGHQPWHFHQICPRPLWFLHHEMLPAWNESSAGRVSSRAPLRQRALFVSRLWEVNNGHCNRWGFLLIFWNGVAIDLQCNIQESEPELDTESTVLETSWNILKLQTHYCRAWVQLSDKFQPVLNLRFIDQAHQQFHLGFT